MQHRFKEIRQIYMSGSPIDDLKMCIIKEKILKQFLLRPVKFKNLALGPRISFNSCATSSKLLFNYSIYSNTEINPEYP